MAPDAPGSDPSVLAAALLPEAEPDRTVVGPYQAHGIGQCVVCHDGRFGRGISLRRHSHQRPSKQNELHLQSRSCSQESCMIVYAFLLGSLSIGGKELLQIYRTISATICVTNHLCSVAFAKLGTLLEKRNCDHERC